MPPRQCCISLYISRECNVRSRGKRTSHTVPLAEGFNRLAGGWTGASERRIGQSVSNHARTINRTSTSTSSPSSTTPAQPYRRPIERSTQLTPCRPTFASSAIWHKNPYLALLQSVRSTRSPTAGTVLHVGDKIGWLEGGSERLLPWGSVSGKRVQPRSYSIASAIDHAIDTRQFGISFHVSLSSSRRARSAVCRRSTRGIVSAAFTGTEQQALSCAGTFFVAGRRAVPCPFS